MYEVLVGSVTGYVFQKATTPAGEIDPIESVLIRRSTRVLQELCDGRSSTVYLAVGPCAQ